MLCVGCFFLLVVAFGGGCEDLHGNAWDRGTQQRFRCNCMALCDVYALCVAHTHTHIPGPDICTSSRSAINCVPVRVSVAVHDATRSAARRFTTQSVFHFMRASAPRGTYFCNLKCPHAMSRARAARAHQHRAEIMSTCVRARFARVRRQPPAQFCHSERASIHRLGSAGVRVRVHAHQVRLFT